MGWHRYLLVNDSIKLLQSDSLGSTSGCVLRIIESNYVILSYGFLQWSWLGGLVAGQFEFALNARCLFCIFKVASDHVIVKRFSMHTQKLLRTHGFLSSVFFGGSAEESCASGEDCSVPRIISVVFQDQFCGTRKQFYVSREHFCVSGDQFCVSR